MTIQNKLLHEILKGREARAGEIKKLNEENLGNIICFTINIPGPHKLSDNYYFAFNEGVLALEEILNAKALKRIKRMSGFEAYFISDKSPIDLKKLTVNLEERHPLGRLFDIDIFYKNLSKISREQLSISKRKCLLCDSPAVECGRSRTHSVEELIICINKLINEYRENNLQEKYK